MSGVPSLNSVYHALDLLGEDHRSVQVLDSRNYMLYFYGFKYQVNKKRKKRGKYFMEKCLNNCKDILF